MNRTRTKTTKPYYGYPFGGYGAYGSGSYGAYGTHFGGAYQGQNPYFAGSTSNKLTTDSKYRRFVLRKS